MIATKHNLLFVITKLELGGAQKHLLDLVRGWDRQGYAITIFTCGKGLLLGDAAALEGVTVHCSRFLDRQLNPIKDLCAFFELYAFIRRNRVRVVHTHSSKAGLIGRLAARAAGVPVVIHTVHGWSFNDYQPGLFRRTAIMMERCAASFSDRLIVVSLHDKHKGLANRIGSEDKYRVVRYGVADTAQGRVSADIRREFGIAPTDLLIGTIACLKPQKAPFDLVSLARLVCTAHPQARFMLVGDGTLRPAVERLIRANGLDGRVTLAGWRRDIPQVLAALDVFVLTSRWEGLPIAALEAMRAGLPVVATDTGGIAEVIRDKETGFLVRPGDMDAMARILDRLLLDLDLRERVGLAAQRSLGTEFTVEAQHERTRAVYEELLCAPTMRRVYGA